MSESTEYAAGMSIDNYGAGLPTLLWHGQEPNRRRVLAPLAGAIAERGLHVFVPDWRSSRPDGGRADLLGSVRFVQEATGAVPLVIGWSLGGTAAASLALNGRRLGLGDVSAVCLAGAFTAPDPLSGRPFADQRVPRRAGSIQLVHGRQDNVVDVEDSRVFAERLRAAGWFVDLHELDVDHAGIAMTVHTDGDYRPATGSQVVSAAQTVVDVAAAAGRR